MSERLRVVVLGEKPQGATWLGYLLASDRFDVVAGVPRLSDRNVWWERDAFAEILRANEVPVVSRDELARIEYDVLWSLMYGFIIEAEHIERAGLFSLNLHESPLPKFRGCNGYSHAILEGEDRYGTTFHFLDAELDAGEIIDQEHFPIRAGETSKELYQRTMLISNELFKRNLETVAGGELPRRPNPTEGEPIKKRSSLLDLKEFQPEQGVESMFATARAFDFVPFEPGWITVGGRKFYVFVEDSLGRVDHSAAPALEFASPAELVDTCMHRRVFRVAGLDRPMVVMDEDAYARSYALFRPEYSWLSESNG